MFSLHRYVGQVPQALGLPISVLSAAQAKIAESFNPALGQLQSGIDELAVEVRELKAYEASATADWTPNQYSSSRLEYSYRTASVPYCRGSGVVMRGSVVQVRRLSSDEVSSGLLRPSNEFANG
jgi:hypothetical protein